MFQLIIINYLSGRPRNAQDNTGRQHGAVDKMSRNKILEATYSANGSYGSEATKTANF